MTNDLHLSTQELIHEIERKDRRFRTFQAVSISIVGVGVIILLVINYNIQAQNRTLLAKQNSLTSQLKTSVSDLENNNNTKLQDLQTHIDCLFKIATTPHTTTNPPLVSSLSRCQLTSSSGGATGSTKSAVSPNASQTKTPNTNNNSGSQTGAASNQPPKAQPTTGQSQGFLQKNIVQPIVNVVKGLF